MISANASESPFSWGRLPDLPDREGLAGVFAGVIQDGDDAHLIVAGGANFPAERPWAGGKKVYHNSIYTLKLGVDDAQWVKQESGLEDSVAYGMSVTNESRGVVYFIGGKTMDAASGKEIALAAVWEFSMANGKLLTKKLPPLPVACSEGVGELVDGKIIVGTGVTNRSADPAEGMVVQRKLFTFDTTDVTAGSWGGIELPEAARGRMYAVAGVRGSQFYLFGGRDFAASDGDMPDRIFGLDFLKDAWVFNVPSASWKQLADMPEARSAAPATAVPVGVSHLLMMGGVPVEFLREQIEARPDKNGQGMDHPGFPSSMLAYDTITNSWAKAGDLPTEVKPDHATNATGSTWATVTTPLVIYKGAIYIPTGEIKPGVRSPQVLAGKVHGRKASFGVINWIVVAVYLLGMVGIGYWFMMREGASSTDDYFRGGQRIPFWVAGLSIFATMLSAITFMAIPGAAYATNWNGYIGQWPILVIIPLVVLFYLPFYRRLNITTAYEYLEKRFNVACRVIASVAFMLFHVGRVAIVLYLPALALSSVTNINIFVAIGVIGVLCIIYTVMGGIEAVVWTDAIQALVLIGGALLCFGLVIAHVDGGFGAITSAMSEQSKGITASWDFSDLSIGKASTSGFVIFIAFLFANLPSYTAGQDVVQRYVTTPTEKEAAKSLWMNIFMVLVGSAIFFALGTALYVFYQNKPELLDPALPAKDSILPFFIMQNLPVGVAGLIIAGVFAASQSTISSSLNSVATAFVTDVYGRLLKPESSDHQQLNVARTVVIILGVIGMLVSAYIAFTKVDSAFMLFNTFIGFALGPLGGLFALGVFTKHAGGKAGLGALLIGVVSVVSIHLLNQSGAIDVMPLLYGFFGFTSTLVAGIILGFVLPSRPEEVNGLTIYTQAK
ncbi:sodium:solute symporter family transporter [Oceaniferula spumae]